MPPLSVLHQLFVPFSLLSQVHFPPPLTFLPRPHPSTWALTCRRWGQWEWTRIPPRRWAGWQGSVCSPPSRTSTRQRSSAKHPPGRRWAAAARPRRPGWRWRCWGHSSWRCWWWRSSPAWYCPASPPWWWTDRGTGSHSGSLTRWWSRRGRAENRCPTLRELHRCNSCRRSGRGCKETWGAWCPF